MYLRLYCPICQKTVEAWPVDGHYVCPHCGYVFSEHPVVEASEYMFTKDGTSFRTHTPVVDATVDKVYKSVHISYSSHDAKTLEKIMNCIYSAIGNTKVGRKKVNKKWLIQAMLEIIERSQDKTLSRSELLSKYAKTPTRKKIAITALAIVCGRCVKCVP